MREDYKIKLLEKNEVKKFVRIIRESFDSQYLVTSIYRGKGIEHFIEYELDNTYSPYRYLVAYNDNQIVGCAEFKIIADSEIFFLNMIASDKDAKSKGIGKAILNFAIELFTGLGYKKLQLDVFQDNKIALNWYKKIGFKQIDLKSLYEIKKSKLIFEERSFYIQNLPQFKEIKEIFGFNYIDVIIDKKSIRIGVIEDSLILRAEYSDSVIIAARKIYDKLDFSNIYFIGSDNLTIKEELILMNKILRMEYII
jgi:ribosomal protein S18 acetylase RimI-like enzyme